MWLNISGLSTVTRALTDILTTVIMIWRLFETPDLEAEAD